MEEKEQIGKGEKITKWFDFFFNKMLPKKLMVVVIATIIVFKDIDPPEEFWWILLGYMGVNGISKIPAAIKKIRDAKGTSEEGS